MTLTLISDELGMRMGTPIVTIKARTHQANNQRLGTVEKVCSPSLHFKASGLLVKEITHWLFSSANE